MKKTGDCVKVLIWAVGPVGGKSLLRTIDLTHSKSFTAYVYVALLFHFTVISAPQKKQPLQLFTYALFMSFCESLNYSTLSQIVLRYGAILHITSVLTWTHVYIKAVELRVLNSCNAWFPLILSFFILDTSTDSCKNVPPAFHLYIGILQLWIYRT